MSTREHWEHVYGTKPATGVSWYAPHLARSLALIGRAAGDRGARIIDVGGGASTLVDDLLERGYHALTVLDLSEQALAVARARLGDAGAEVTWLAADVTTVELPEADSAREVHETPWGSAQEFTYCYCLKLDG